MPSPAKVKAYSLSTTTAETAANIPEVVVFIVLGFFPWQAVLLLPALSSPFEVSLSVPTMYLQRVEP